MARLEIPSIVVHNGSNSAPGSPTMRSQRTLSKQAEFEELEDEPPCLSVKEGPGAQTPSVEVEEKVPPSRVRSQAKVKLLVRSHAMREETSPPPDPDSHHCQQSPPTPQLSTNNLAVVSRHKVRQQGSFESSSPSLSRDNSTEYTDSTGVDLQLFISETLNKNHKDRMILLKIEQEMVNLIKDTKRNHHKFPPMSSYQRMLVHRVAAYFGLEHNVDTTGNCVIVNRTKNTRLPDTKFRHHIRDELLFPEEPRRSILKRDSSSFEEGSNFKSPERQFSSESRRSKSFEEREEEYEKARKRIFNRDEECLIHSHDSLQDSSQRSSQEDLRWPGEILPWSSSDSDTSGRLRNNTMHHCGQLRHTRLLKVESFEGRDTLKANSLRQAVSKSYSFGGYPVSVMVAGDNCTTNSSSRQLIKQDSGSSMSSRLSPLSSGYKSQSQRSDTTMSATPSPTATPITQYSSASQQNIQSTVVTTSPSDNESQTVMWAVTNMSAVPPGSVLINPKTGQPYINPDGSIYRFDPSNPPKVVSEEEVNDCSTYNETSISSASQTDNHTQQVQPLVKKSSCTSSTSSSTVTMVPSVMTTATSPSLPVSPSPSATQSLHPQMITVCHPNQCPYAPQQVASETHTFQAQQAYIQPHQTDTVYGSMAQSSPLLYTGYNVVPVPGSTNGVQGLYETRLPDGNPLTVADLSSYLMGLSIREQRSNADPQPSSSMIPPPPPPPPPPPQNQQYQVVSSFWQQQQQHHHTNPIQHSTQTQAVPVYYVPPNSGNSIANATSPLPINSGSTNTAAARYVALPSFQSSSTHQHTPTPGLGAQSGSERAPPSSNCFATGYPVATFVTGMSSTGSGDCVPLYTQPALHMLYSSPSGNASSSVIQPMSNSATLPYYPAASPLGMTPYIATGQSTYRPHTPPHTPVQSQAMCSIGGHPYIYLNGTTGYGHSNATANQQQSTIPTSIPTAHYIPSIMPNIGLFRASVPMVSSISSNSPPRQTRETKPSLNRVQPVPHKDRSGLHYDVCRNVENSNNVRYPNVPSVFGGLGLRLMPNLVGSPLQQSLPATSPSLRIPFSIAPHPHRVQAPLFPANQSLSSDISTAAVGRNAKPRKLR